MDFFGRIESSSRFEDQRIEIGQVEYYVRSFVSDNIPQLHRAVIYPYSPEPNNPAVSLSLPCRLSLRIYSWKRRFPEHIARLCSIQATHLWRPLLSS